MGSNHIELSKLINILEKSNHYLSQKVLAEPSYSKLIETLDSEIYNLKIANKPIIKIVSPCLTLATKFQAINEANQELRSLYEFQVVSPIKQLKKITIDCDVICLIYNSSQNILAAHQKLIKLANKNNISLILLVEQQEINTLYANLTDWLAAQNCSQLNQLLLPLEDFINLDDEQNIIVYQQLLFELSKPVKEKFVARIVEQSITKIQHFFATEIKNVWREIKQTKDKYLQGEPPEQYQSKIRQAFNKINRDKQQFFKCIQQNINHSRSDYLNPFISNSWIFTIQQVIQESQLKIIQEEQKKYIYLTVEYSNCTEYIHSYILGLYQQKITDALQFQWSEINFVYAGGGLEQLTKKINTELETISSLCPQEFYLMETVLTEEKQPDLDLAKFIDSSCLKTNSRILFDYSFTQSSWFRLLISVLVGTGIYLITKLFFGTGKFIGFVILIFQAINLLIGQDIRKMKLKQHKNELKRTVENKYQNLIRLLVDKVIQTLIIFLEQENQLYQQQIDAIANMANTKLEEIKQTINQYQSRINNLNQDRAQILSWFD
ncbi:hypothetical protein [Pleurocapsa sp. PCC 7319]|uniref:hypothetical protein n=1 Tax=Pleurocapsa sp. PCC 7319 TaxID=118161 RepID=UPI0003462334|nr:hypothetical protein [Pleurocapsa sp. PCC 7319]